MKRTIVMLFLLALLGCNRTASYTINKTGSPPDASKQDIYQCKMEALNATKDICRGSTNIGMMLCQRDQQKDFNNIMKECLEARGNAVRKR
jgi:hypothetical protein